MKAQYAILRFAKYKGPEIGHIESHNERTKENGVLYFHRLSLRFCHTMSQSSMSASSITSL